MHVAQEHKVIKFSENGDLYLRAFLLDASKNENGWKVDSASIDQNIESFVGMPLVLTQEYDHPKWIEGGLIENVKSQLRYAIGQITKILKTGSIRDAIIKITDPIARAAIENNDIPLFTSPRLAHDPDDPIDRIKNWLGLHLAIVDKPAFGDKAAVKGACYGAAAECHIALKEAKKEDCGFCVKTTLLKLVNIADASINTSQFTHSEKSQSLMADSQFDAASFISKADHENTVKTLEAKIDAFKSVAEEATKRADAKIAAIEEEKRADKIAGLVNSKIADGKKAEETIKKFVDAKVSPEIVAEAMSFIPEPVKPVDNSEKFSAKADAKAEPARWFDKQRSYERSLIK